MTKNTISIDNGEVHIWYASLKTSPKEIKRYRALLSSPELKRAKRFRFKESQRKFIASRGIGREILSAYVGRSPGMIDIARSPTRKPFLPQSKIQFNLSHSEDSLIFGVTFNNSIGIDYQVMYEISNLDTLVRNFFSPLEQKLYQRTPEEKTLHFFFCTWVRKEAYMKATGLGFHLPSNQFSVATRNGNEPTLQAKPDHPIPVQDWSVRDLPLKPGYKGALAVKGEIQDIKHFHHSP